MFGTTNLSPERSTNLSRAWNFIAAILVCLPLTLAAQSSPSSASVQTAPQSGDVQARVENYLRNLYAWGPSFKLTMGAIKPSPVPGLLELPVTVSKDGHADSATVFVTKDGRYLFRGDMADTFVDPLAAIRAKLKTHGAPSEGPVNANITLVEFADFECPSCRALDRILRHVLPKYSDVRLVYKDFPLTEIHPWAMTAAIAGRCAFQQDPKVFWKLHNAIFDDQDLISPSTVWDKMNEYATNFGLNDQAFRACMANPETTQEVEKSIAEGHALNITSTPTIFVNGRRIVGANQSLLQQYISFGRK